MNGITFPKKSRTSILDLYNSQTQLCSKGRGLLNMQAEYSLRKRQGMKLEGRQVQGGEGKRLTAVTNN